MIDIEIVNIINIYYDHNISSIDNHSGLMFDIWVNKNFNKKKIIIDIEYEPYKKLFFEMNKNEEWIDIKSIKELDNIDLIIFNYDLKED